MQAVSSLKRLYQAANTDFLQDTLDLFSGKRAGHMSPWLYSIPEFEGDRADGSIQWAKRVEEAKNGSAYYVFREEQAVINHGLPDIAKLTGQPTTLVDLGPGSVDAFQNKVAPVMRALGGDVQKYVPVDVSEFSINAVSAASKAAFPAIAVSGVHKNFLTDAFVYDTLGSRSIATFFGLTLFNLQIDPRVQGLPEMMLASSLDRLRKHHRTPENILLLTQDTTQDVPKLETGYLTTSSYYKALLYRILRDLNVSGDFDPDAFTIGAAFFPETSCLSMYFAPTRNMNFAIEGQSVSLKKGERLFFHNAFKMSPDRFLRVAQSAGYTHLKTISQPGNNHVLHMLAH